MPIRLLLALLFLFIASPLRAADIVVQPDAGDGFVVLDNAGTTERLRIDESDGDISREGSLFLHTRGPGSTFVGTNAGPSNTGFANTGVGVSSLAANTSGVNNSAFGTSALLSNTSGGNNSAFGTAALTANTTGSNNSAFGLSSLATNTASDNSAFGTLALFANTSGQRNTALGSLALQSNTVGDDNTAVGHFALNTNDGPTGQANTAVGSSALANSGGARNSALGAGALASNTSGASNAALGNDALGDTSFGLANAAFGDSAAKHSTGDLNSAFGQKALYMNASGDGNTAIGRSALENHTSGSNNIALGKDAGDVLLTGSNNMYLGSRGVPTAESNRIRVGASTHTETFIAGISGNVVAGGSPVIVNASGELGNIASSSRFKREISSLEREAEQLHRLRPVSFRYREEYVGEGEASIEYGLVAEEVAETSPDLVVYDEAGRPVSVRYQMLAPLLVGEIQRQRSTIEEQRSAIDDLRQRLERLECAASQEDQPCGT